MIKAIIFDCFGVLVGRGFDETYRHAGGDPNKDKKFIDELLDQANRGLMTSGEFRSKVMEQIGISAEEYERAVNEAEQPNHELLHYIVSLRPRYKTAVISNANVGTLQRKIGDEWLKKCFNAVIVSAEVGFIKPEPEIYQLTLDKLDAKPEESIFIDDKSLYCTAARELGFKTILYRDFPSMKSELEEILAGSDH